MANAPLKAFFQTGHDRLRRRRADEMPDVYMQVVDAGGDPYDLTTHTATADLVQVDGRTAVSSISCTVDTPLLGKLHFPITAANMAKIQAPVELRVVLTITLSGADVQPTNRPILEVLW